MNFATGLIVGYCIGTVGISTVIGATMILGTILSSSYHFFRNHNDEDVLNGIDN